MNEHYAAMDRRDMEAMYPKAVDARSELAKALDKIPELEARIVELEEMVRELSSRMEVLWGGK
jgi:ABC-type Fe3+-citrate transport system substrate-binding protein